MLKGQLSVPKQTIYKMKYVMVDEKWIHEQDKTKPNQKKWIMGKCFACFTGIKRKGKRSRLVNTSL